jgi:hypothetical protein
MEMTMTKTNPENAPGHPAPVTIEQVENGYLLTFSFDTEARYPRREMSNYAVQKPHVFPSKAALFEHLAEHFTHACPQVAVDPVVAVSSDGL